MFGGEAAQLRDSYRRPLRASDCLLRGRFHPGEPSLRGTLRGDAAGPADDRIDVKVAADVDSPWGSYGESQMRFGVDIGYQRLLRVRGGYAFVRDGLSGPSVGMGVATGAIGVDFARTFLSSADFVADNPTFVSFRLVF